VSSMLVTWPGAPGGGRSSGSRSMLSVKLTTSWGGYPPDESMQLNHNKNAGRDLE
jgi:hypothetical protein